ncbi:MAG: hypothetical protein IMZ53_10145 [Thermoplasmata archaeon]|nr:hypothetical protein [Thermoplasmata archaeon]
MDTQTSIIYYTDNSLDEKIAKFCRDHLVVASQGKPIVSVSQRPTDLGINICLGEIGRSHLSMYSQILRGVEEAKTPYISLVEHDCLYSPEHFNWIPPQEDVFYYNLNVWFVNWSSGKYYYQRRRVLSQLICGREIALKAIQDKIWLLKHGYMIRKGMTGACEFGVRTDKECFEQAAFCEADWLKTHDIKDIKTEPIQIQTVTQEPGVCDERKEYQGVLAQFKDLGKEVSLWKADTFRTELPNVDIRHTTNFSRGRKPKDVVYTIPYWGTMKDLMEN